MKVGQEHAAARLRHPVVRAVLSLTGVQAVQVALPLLTLPYLTRLLGPAGWGEVAVAFALGNLAAVLPEYGFSVSATRALARQTPADASGSLVASVVRAKGLLSLGAVVLVLIAAGTGVLPRLHGALLAGACLIAVGHGLWMGWYFEGVERSGTFFRIVLVSRLAYVALLLLLVRAPAEGPLVPVLYGLSGLLVAVLALRHMPSPWRGAWGDTGRVLRQGWPSFLQRLLVMTYTTGNVFWLSLLAGPAAAGGYGVAEQSARAACLALVPLSRALYPRYSRLQGRPPERWMRFTLPGLAMAGIVLSFVVFGLAGLVPLVFGAAFEPYVPVVRWLAPLPLLVALSQYWTVQRLQARGHDGPVAVLFGIGAAADLGLAVLLVPRYGAAGMAVALLTAETLVTLGSALLARRYSSR